MSVKTRDIPISKPVTGREEWQAVKEPLMSGWLTSGPKVKEFEQKFAERHEVDYAIAVTSATTALHLALAALEVGPGDEVIVPAFTWVATANVVLYQSADVVFCDIDPSTFNLDSVELQKKITNKTKAIIPVHLFGLCADIDRIKEAAGDIPLVEDAACAAGAAYKGAPAGGLASIGCFSFHPRKSITTGEGGMVTTNDEKLAEKIQMLRNHGAAVSEEQRHHGPKPYILPDFNLMGYNYRMTDLQGAVGTVQLSKLDQFIEERDKWAQYYQNKLADVGWFKTPGHSGEYKHGWQSFVTMVDEDKATCSRNEVMEILKEKGIATRPGTHAVHMLNFYNQKYSLRADDFPNARDANNYSMAIPLHNQMNESDYEYIVNALKSI